jgi:hypothetical protein
LKRLDDGADLGELGTDSLDALPKLIELRWDGLRRLAIGIERGFQ